MLEENGAMNLVLTRTVNGEKKTIETYACFSEELVDSMLKTMKDKIKAGYVSDKNERILNNESWTISLFTY